MIPWRAYFSVPRALAAASALILLAVLLVGGSEAMSEGIVAPEQALRMAREGEVTIIDIRRPDEWRKTGVPSGAQRATIRSSLGTSGFLSRIAALTKGDKSAPIALICAGGVRSKHASRLLRKRGYTQVMDISEGMLGNGKGAGWLRRKLPISPCPNCE
jgi:rhodanese-related sulfurtransferase